MRNKAWMTVVMLWAVLAATGCGPWLARKDAAMQRSQSPAVSGIAPGMRVEQAVSALQAMHATVTVTEEPRERGGRTYRFVTVAAHDGGTAPFDLKELEARFIDGELVRLEASFGSQLTGESLEDEFGPAWAKQGGVMRWFFEHDKAALEAYRGYAGGGWHLTLEVCAAGTDFVSVEAQAQAMQNWWKLVTVGPLPDKNILPPGWVRQSTPQEALTSMARALRERDAVAYQYLSYETSPQPTAVAMGEIPGILRGKGRVIVALQESGARMTLLGDEAVLKGPAGEGSVTLKRVRGRWFVE